MITIDDSHITNSYEKGKAICLPDVDGLVKNILELINVTLNQRSYYLASENFNHTI